MESTALRPSRYSDRESSTFFHVAGTLVSLRYWVEERRRYLLLPAASMTRLEAKVDDGAYQTTHGYEIPRSLHVGEEIAVIERGLYAFMDDVIRGAMQLRVLEATGRAVEALEDEHLYQLPADPRSELAGDAEGGAASDVHERRVVEELAQRLVTAVSHVTNVTSLSIEGLRDYQRERTMTLERLARAASPGAALQTRDVLQAVEAFLRYDADPGEDAETLKARALEYLVHLRKRSGGAGPLLTAEQLEIVLSEFVPACMALRRRYEEAVRVPSDLGGHVVGSFFGGGITGWLTISLFGEALLSNLAGVSLDLPGWWIGAGTAFAWPFLRAAYGALTREGDYERGREGLFRRMKVKLGLSWPEPDALPPA